MMSIPERGSLPARGIRQAFTLWRSHRTERAWQAEDSTVRSGCTARRTALWRRLSYRYPWPPKSPGTEVRNEVAAVDRIGGNLAGAAGHYGAAAARSAKGTAVHSYTRGKETRCGGDDPRDRAGPPPGAD